MSVYGKVKERLKAHKVWFDHFRKRLTFKNVKITREAASVDQETADNFQRPLRKSRRKKNNVSRQRQQD